MIYLQREFVQGYSEFSQYVAAKRRRAMPVADRPSTSHSLKRFLPFASKCAGAIVTGRISL